jgi:hypothetical protein
MAGQGTSGVNYAMKSTRLWKVNYTIKQGGCDRQGV